MAAYKQHCPNCVGIVLRAERDHARWVRLAHDARMDAASARQEARSELNIALGQQTRHQHVDGECTAASHRNAAHSDERDALEADRAAEQYDAKATAAEILMHSRVPAGCVLCGGVGALSGNGSARIGGSGKTRNAYGVMV